MINDDISRHSLSVSNHLPLDIDKTKAIVLNSVQM